MQYLIIFFNKKSLRIPGPQLYFIFQWWIHHQRTGNQNFLDRLETILYASFWIYLNILHTTHSWPGRDSLTPLILSRRAVNRSSPFAVVELSQCSGVKPNKKNLWYYGRNESPNGYNWNASIITSNLSAIRERRFHRLCGGCMPFSLKGD